MSYVFEDRKSYAHSVLDTIFKEIYNIRNTTLGKEGKDYHIRILIGRMEFACLQNWLAGKDVYSTVFYQERNPSYRAHEGWRAFGVKVDVFMNIDEQLRIVKIYPPGGRRGT